MKQHQFNKADPIVDDLHEEVSRVLEGEAGAQLRALLVGLAAKLDHKFGVSLQVDVTVVDWEREASLPLLQTGLSVDRDQPYRTHGDSSPHRYLVDGEIIVVPHDYCPACWGEWSWKFERTSCPSCDAKLGQEVFILLDNDLCPHCEKGKLSAEHPACERCDFNIDPRFVRWG